VIVTIVASIVSICGAISATQVLYLWRENNKSHGTMNEGEQIDIELKERIKNYTLWNMFECMKINLEPRKLFH
jgi:hypothetical protein